MYVWVLLTNYGQHVLQLILFVFAGKSEDRRFTLLDLERDRALIQQMSSIPNTLTRDPSPDVNFLLA